MYSHLIRRSLGNSKPKKCIKGLVKAHDLGNIIGQAVKNLEFKRPVSSFWLITDPSLFIWMTQSRNSHAMVPMVVKCFIT